MTRTARTGLVFLIGITACAVSAFVYIRGERLADRLLRFGGRIVQAAAQRPNRVAAGFAAVVLLVWLLIGLRCVWESWRERRHSGCPQPRTVANTAPPN